MKVVINDTRQCGIRQHAIDQSDRQSRHVDIKWSPELIGELAEVRAWPELGEFLAEINQLEAFRTTGCNIEGQIDGGLSCPFVDIAFDDELLWVSETAHQILKNTLYGLNGGPTADGLTLHLWHSNATLPDGMTYLSTRLWFDGTREQAQQTFP